MEDTTIKILIVAVPLGLAPYIWIFRKIISRIDRLENRPMCSTSICMTRFDKIEKEQADNNPIFLEIKERLASIEATLKFLIDRK